MEEPDEPRLPWQPPPPRRQREQPVKVLWSADLGDGFVVSVQQRSATRGYLVLLDGDIVRTASDVTLRWDDNRSDDAFLAELRQRCLDVIDHHRRMARQRTPFGDHH